MSTEVIRRGSVELALLNKKKKEFYHRVVQDVDDCFRRYMCILVENHM